MKKILSWTIGSFFRTFGRIIAYLVIGGLIAYFIGKSGIKWSLPQVLLMDVYASNYQMADVITNTTFEINNIAITTNNKRYLSANSSVNFHLESQNVWSPFENDIDYQYGYLSVCASSDFIPTNFTAGYNSKNARIFNSYQSCQVANSNYTTALVYYITWQINTSRACTAGATTTYCELDNNFDFTINKDMEFSLIDFGLSDNQINVDTSNGLVIQQNQTIINSIGNLNTNINATENAINYNGEQGRINDDKNTDKIIDSNKVCTNVEYLTGEYGHYTVTIANNKNIVNTSQSNTNSAYIFDVSKYIGEEIDIIFKDFSPSGINARQYRNNYCFISEFPSETAQECISGNAVPNQRNAQTYSNITIPNGAKYLVMVGTILTNLPSPENYFKVYLGKKICKNGNQALTDTFTDSNSSQATNDASSFFNNFTTDTHGLTGIITAPLNAINSLTSSTCSPLVLPLPFINENLTLPCMRAIYDENFGSFMTLYDVITLGIISYWVMVRIFALVKDFKNPEHDEVEVLEL